MKDTRNATSGLELGVSAEGLGFKTSFRVHGFKVTNPKPEPGKPYNPRQMGLKSWVSLAGLRP